MAENIITIDRVGEIMHAVLSELARANQPLARQELLSRIEKRFSFTPYEKSLHEKSGLVRWQSIVSFYSIDSVKAGYLVKSGGKWELTEEGKKALKLPSGEFIRNAQVKYREWRKAKTSETKEVGVVQEEQIIRQSAYDQAVESARSEIERRIDDLDEWDFQKLVSHLLKGMGYHIRDISQPGHADGGTDILAYRDPLGSNGPRIRVQVKHRDQKVSANEVREHESILRREGDIGLIVSSGGFTQDAVREVRSSVKHIDTVDQDRLIDLWQQYYDQIPETGKALLPLVKVFFLSPTEL
jgi:restriction system protein